MGIPPTIIIVYVRSKMDDWTWSEAGEQALYGVFSVFIILILLTVLTWLTGKIIARFEKPNSSSGSGSKH